MEEPGKLVAQIGWQRVHLGDSHSFLLSFQVSVVLGEGRGVNQDLRCRCDEKYHRLGGRSSPFPGRASQDLTEEALTPLPEQSG